jgi:2-aminoethylphosphonate transport system substrate-binding protein
LTALVNKGGLFVANGDLQMNIDQTKANPNIRIFFPAGPDNQRSTLALPYYAGIVAGAPHAANGKKLLDWLLSKSAQETVADVAQGLPVRTDVKPAGSAYETIVKHLDGVKTWTPDWIRWSPTSTPTSRAGTRRPEASTSFRRNDSYHAASSIL